MLQAASVTRAQHALLLTRWVLKNLLVIVQSRSLLSKQIPVREQRIPKCCDAPISPKPLLSTGVLQAQLLPLTSAFTGQDASSQSIRARPLQALLLSVVTQDKNPTKLDGVNFTFIVHQNLNNKQLGITTPSVTRLQVSSRLLEQNPGPRLRDAQVTSPAPGRWAQHS